MTAPKPVIGRLGEVLVEQQLLERGWHPVRLDTAQMASNADLMAINGPLRVSIQVRTTDTRHKLFFGRCDGCLKEEDPKPFYNSKLSPIIADIVVSVWYGEPPVFVVMPVAFAENLGRAGCISWYNTPKKDGTRRSPGFPLYLKHHIAGTMTDRDRALMKYLDEYQDRWDVLSEPIENLHDPKHWPVECPCELVAPCLGGNYCLRRE